MVRSIKINLPGGEYLFLEAVGEMKDGRNAIRLTVGSPNESKGLLMDGDEVEVLRANLSQMI